MKKILLTLLVLSYSFLALKAQFKVLWNFNYDTGAIGNANGALPVGSLTVLRNKLYGMTDEGGAHGEGSIFSIDTSGKGYKDMFDCLGTPYAPYGNEPLGDLILVGKSLFGVTPNDGKNLGGTIISIDTNGSGITDLVDFPGADNVSDIEANLAYSHGKFYGMSEYGGIYQTGNFFCISTDGSGYSDLYDFNPVQADLNLINSLIISGHKLFGISWAGGIGLGNVFTIDTNGNNYKDLHDFNGTDGEFPQGSYVTISGNKLYGMTYQGGAYNDGCIFSLDTTGNNYKVLLDFNGTTGDSTICSLIISGSKLYGMTTRGGKYDWGCIFSIDTDGTSYTDLHDFSLSLTDGTQPHGSLIRAGGVLYGMTDGGGVYGWGTIFRYTDTTIKKDTEKVVDEIIGNKESIKVFPNPVNTMLNVEISMLSGSVATICIYNTMGEKVRCITLTDGLTVLPVAELPSGIYYYRIIDENNNLIKADKQMLMH